MTPPDPEPVPAETLSVEREPEGMNVATVHGSILRERAEPRDGYEPVPLWLMTLFSVIVFWAGLYLAMNSGGFKANVFNPKLVSWSGGGGAAAGPPDPKAVGKRLFTANCVVCHQTTGLGVAGQFPPLVGSEWLLSNGWHGDNHLVRFVLKGLQGVVTVKGTQYNNAMPAWQQLKDEQIAAILTYVRSEWGNNAPPIPKEYVAKIREQIKDRTEPWTEAELKAIPRELVSEAEAGPVPAQSPGASPAPVSSPAPAASPSGA